MRFTVTGRTALAWWRAYCHHTRRNNRVRKFIYQMLLSNTYPSEKEPPVVTTVVYVNE